jgi:hypothetical protein
MSFWKSLALLLVCFCILATIISTTQARYPERFPDKSVVGQSNHADDASVCWGNDDDLCIEWDTDGSPDGGRITQKDCDGSPCDPLEFYKDGGANVVVLRASSVTNPDAKMTFGPAGASGYSLGANDSHFTGDKFEVDGEAQLDGKIYLNNFVYFKNGYDFRIPDNTDFIFGAGDDIKIRYSGYPSLDTLVIGLGADSNGVIICEAADWTTAWVHPKSNDPTIWGQSADETDVGQFFALSWNRLALGGSGGGLGCINQTFSYTDFTDGGGASGTLVLDEGIPDGAVVQRAILHSLTGFTGDTSAFVQIGDGTDVDRYSTGTPSVFTTNPSGCELREPSGTAWHDDAKSVTVTITSNADFTSVSAGAATVAICYWTP